MRCLIIFITSALQLYIISTSIIQLDRALNPDSECVTIVLDMMTFCDKLIILYAYFFFVSYRAEIQTFFSDWGRMEEHYNAIKGVDRGKMKRTCIIVYILYYIYSISYWFFNSYSTVTGENQINVEDHLIASYYPDLMSNPLYFSWIQFRNIYFDFLFALCLFSPLLSIEFR